MENRYLFRGKAKCIVGTYNFGKEDGEWVEGSLRCDCGKYTIFQFETDSADYIAYEVDPLTICQCTGGKDKNSKLIYENDIAKDDKGNLYKAFWQDNHYQFSWMCVKSEKLPIGAKWNFDCFRGYEMEVIGNVFDNPELLEGGKEQQ